MLILGSIFVFSAKHKIYLGYGLDRYTVSQLKQILVWMFGYKYYLDIKQTFGSYLCFPYASVSHVTQYYPYDEVSYVTQYTPCCDGPM